MPEDSPTFEHRLYPVGALSEKEVVSVFSDSLCAEELSIDDVMNEWREKSKAFESGPDPDLDAPDSELLPIAARSETVARIESLLKSYRYYLPATFDLALVPIKKLITPQVSISLEHARSILEGEKGPIEDDANASLCLGSPPSAGRVEAAFLGSPKNPPYSNALSYLYQFSSDDANVKFISVPSLKPIREIDLATEGADHSFEVKAVPIAVGMGLPLVHVLRVPRGTGSNDAKVNRLVIANGIHRIFRLAELGNTHVAAMVQTMAYDEIANPFIDVTRDRLFIKRPITVSTLADGRISRAFKWKKSKRVITMQVTVNQETSYISL